MDVARGEGRKAGGGGVGSAVGDATATTYCAVALPFVAGFTAAESILPYDKNAPPVKDVAKELAGKTGDIAAKAKNAVDNSTIGKVPVVGKGLGIAAGVAAGAARMPLNLGEISFKYAENVGKGFMDNLTR
jgi:hypothetical protein